MKHINFTICRYCEYYEAGLFSKNCTATEKFVVNDVINGYGKTVGRVKCKDRNDGNCKYYIVSREFEYARFKSEFVLEAHNAKKIHDIKPQTQEGDLNG
jgi:hypothetical protein